MYVPLTFFQIVILLHHYYMLAQPCSIYGEIRTGLSLNAFVSTSELSLYKTS